MAWNITATIGLDTATLQRLDQIISILQTTASKETSIMATLDTILAAVEAETTAVASLQAFITGLQGQISAIGGLTAAQQAEIDTIFTDVSSNSAKITAAITPPVAPAPAATPAPTATPAPAPAHA
jgi:hypothetical protein